MYDSYGCSNVLSCPFFFLFFVFFSLDSVFPDAFVPECLIMKCFGAYTTRTSTFFSLIRLFCREKGFFSQDFFFFIPEVRRRIGFRIPTSSRFFFRKKLFRAVSDRRGRIRQKRIFHGRKADVIVNIRSIQRIIKSRYTE